MVVTRSFGRRMVGAAVCAAFMATQVVLFSPAAFAQTMVTLRDGRQFEAEMIDDARSGSVSEGDEVRFRVLADIEVHGRIAVPAGAEGAITVARAEKNGRFGKPGAVTFGEGWVQAGVERVAVRIAGRSRFKGGSKLTTGLLLLIVGVLFVKGGQGGLAEGEHLFLEIDETRQVPAAG